jgi:hypothetical protein
VWGVGFVVFCGCCGFGGFEVWWGGLCGYVVVVVMCCVLCVGDGVYFSIILSYGIV